MCRAARQAHPRPALLTAPRGTCTRKRPPCTHPPIHARSRAPHAASPYKARSTRTPTHPPRETHACAHCAPALTVRLHRRHAQLLQRVREEADGALAGGAVVAELGAVPARRRRRSAARLGPVRGGAGPSAARRRRVSTAAARANAAAAALLGRRPARSSPRALAPARRSCRRAARPPAHPPRGVQPVLEHVVGVGALVAADAGGLLLHVGAGDAGVVVRARVAPHRLLPRVRKRADRPVVHKALGAGDHLHAPLRKGGARGAAGGGVGGGAAAAARARAAAAPAAASKAREPSSRPARGGPTPGRPCWRPCCWPGARDLWRAGKGPQYCPHDRPSRPPPSALHRPTPHALLLQPQAALTMRKSSLLKSGDDSSSLPPGRGSSGGPACAMRTEWPPRSGSSGQGQPGPGGAQPSPYLVCPKARPHLAGEGRHLRGPGEGIQRAARVHGERPARQRRCA